MIATVIAPFAMFLAGCLACPHPLTDSPSAHHMAHAHAHAHMHHVDWNNNNVTAAVKRAAAGQYDGDITYYDVGLGACGHDDSGKGSITNIVAVSAALMGSGSDSDLCNRKVHIKGDNGNEVVATVRDKCPSCPEGGLDVSEKVFKEVVGSLGVGRAKVTWTFA
ncbi:RlpA-like double-psi beta-barrel-protein domain-containing protein-containing protein [Podospora didyma]|uniref:RlpA-like double-psi beta-barrel-protein domain-containing protein-containing protein n=1 Tax=Podospora didyma TaxID=330526 RepID=A0AAE0N9W3_9PEZI|nr:RlpA-like double-psi beta-barrel-protein domain-containing protein-containing protein [Podospora didyma]